MKKQLLAIGLVCLTFIGSGCQQDKVEITEVEAHEVEGYQLTKTIESEEEIVSEVIVSDRQALTDALDAYLIDQSFNGVALIASGDEMLLLKGYGFANVNDLEEMTVNHQFHIASVSKSFVAVSILQLVEEGKLNLDDTLDHFFEGVTNGDQITIHHLLTHTSGLYCGDDLTNYTDATPVDEVIAPAFSQDSAYYDEPGAYAIYSNLGYDLLGAIIEQVSGMAYEDYIEEHIFKPAHMTHSGLNTEGATLEHLATAYSGNISDNDEAKVLHPSFGYSSGGLHSTAMDLYYYDRALHANTLITQESYDLMTTAYSKVGTKSYGYGWYVDAGIDDTVSHTGNLLGWHSMFLRHQEDKVTVILLTNHDENDMYMAYNLARLVLAEVENE